MSAAIEIVRNAAVEYSAGRTDVPIRSHLAIHEPSGEMLVMPGYIPSMKALGVKVWSRLDPADSASEISSTILYRDLERQVELVMDGGHVTDIRTGALSGLAFERLSPPGAARAALIGAGVQARTQLDALLATTKVREVRVWTRSPTRGADFVRTAQSAYSDRAVTLAGSAEDAVRGAAIVVTATTATAPVFDDAWVESDALVCGIGSHAPGAAEIDPATVGRAELVVVDSRAGALGVGDIAGPIADGLLVPESVLEIGELVAREVSRSFAAPAVFKSVGFAALDIAAAKVVTIAALKSGIGTWADLH